MIAPVKSNTTKPRASLRGSEESTIRVVAARTGLTMETLRAWERRYGFPQPQRRPGSNRRLYRATDVERLLAIQRALARGYRVGDVIGKTLLELDGLTDLSPRAAPTASSPLDVEALLGLLVRNQVPELESQLRRAAAALGPRRFVTELAHPFAVGIGQAWADGRLSVRHEHLATECLITQLRQMLAAYQDIDARPLVLLATLPGEPHTLALQMVALYLFVIGGKPRLLGGPTPHDQIAETALLLGADAVGLTVTPASDRTEARRAIKSLRRELPSAVPIWVGGGGAGALGLDDPGVRVVTSWTAIDEVVAERRGELHGRRVRRA